MINIVFEVHAITVDNENSISSGFYDARLSKAGIEQCGEFGERYADMQFDVVYCSDLQRSYKTAELAFSNLYPIVRDARLRECNYGDLTRHPASEVESQRIKHAEKVFPNGESYVQVFDRVGSFLSELVQRYDQKSVLIIGHGATWRALEYWLNDVPLATAVARQHIWQPGWEYKLPVANFRYPRTAARL